MKAALIGHPVAHSRSPALHQAAYKTLGFDITYEAIDVPASELTTFIESIRSHKQWRGLSVTMPHKYAAIACVDVCDAEAVLLRALNTISKTTDGRLIGNNTDLVGISAALNDAAPHLGSDSTGNYSHTRSQGGQAADLSLATVLGGGATARTALAALVRLGVRRVVLAAREPQRAHPTQELAEQLGLECTVTTLAEVQLGPDSGAHVVSTLPPRAADTLPVSGRGLGVLLDVVYDPWPTALAGRWKRAGGAVVSGLEMLVHQGLAQVEIITGIRLAERPEVARAVRASLGLSTLSS